MWLLPLKEAELTIHSRVRRAGGDSLLRGQREHERNTEFAVEKPDKCSLGQVIRATSAESSHVDSMSLDMMG